MYIPFHVIKELCEKEDFLKFNIELDASDTHNAQIFHIDENKMITVNLLLTEEYLTKLESMHIDNISIYYNEALMKLLKREYPEMYVQEDKAPLYKVEKDYEGFELANKLSSFNNKIFKERNLRILQDVISVSSRIKRIIVMYNELLNRDLINSIKQIYSESADISYTTSEKGLLMIIDEKEYKSDPQLLRLYFTIRKIFEDLKYKYFKIVNVQKGFIEYFEPSDAIHKKAVIFIGKTPDNLVLHKKLRIFDPFVKTKWITQENKDLSPDKLFDGIVSILGKDYTEELKLFSLTKEEKKQLLPQDIQNYRKLLSELGRKFNINSCIDIFYDILEKGKEYDMFQPKTHLINLLTDLRYTPDKIFEQLMYP